jgi:hypothetical protein
MAIPLSMAPTLHVNVQSWFRNVQTNLNCIIFKYVYKQSSSQGKTLLGSLASYKFIPLRTVCKIMA